LIFTLYAFLTWITQMKHDHSYQLLHMLYLQAVRPFGSADRSDRCGVPIRVGLALVFECGLALLACSILMYRRHRKAGWNTVDVLIVHIYVSRNVSLQMSSSNHYKWLVQYSYAYHISKR
jgi:hypothetical protein